MAKKRNPEKIVREIKRKTRRKFSSEEKIRIVLEGLGGEEMLAEMALRLRWFKKTRLYRARIRNWYEIHPRREDGGHTAGRGVGSAYPNDSRTAWSQPRIVLSLVPE